MTTISLLLSCTEFPNNSLIYSTDIQGKIVKVHVSFTNHLRPIVVLVSPCLRQTNGLRLVDQVHRVRKTKIKGPSELERDDRGSV